MGLERRYRVMVGNPERVLVHLVGCGGTGSFLALHLARMAYDAARGGGPALDLIFYDGDRVELANVGRQNFAPGEVGENKALALARRYSLAFGLEIEAVAAMFDAQTPLFPRLGLGWDFPAVVVGAVDTPAARGEIAANVLRYTYGVPWWLDVGNHEHSGQVLLGNRGDLEGPAISPLGWCEGLPLPSVVAPDLLDEGLRTKDELAVGCAEALAAGAQSLMINQVMAGWAAVMVCRLLVSRDLDFWQVWVDLGSGNARSVGITNGTEPQMDADEREPQMDADERR